MIAVQIPGHLRAFTEGRGRVEIASPAATVGEALERLWALHPGVRDRVVTEQGEVRPHVNVFVGSESIRFTGGLATPVQDGVEIWIVPAVSGGRGPSPARKGLTMRLSSMLPLIATILALMSGESRPDDRVPTPPPARETNSEAPDSAAKAVVGTYVSDVDPQSVVTIGSLGGDGIRVEADARFLSLGWFDGTEYVGILRAPARRPPSQPARLGWLRFRRVESGGIEAELFDDPDSTRAHRERWTRTVHRPAVGEYVYVEELPEVIEKTSPVYPEEARRQRIEGVVALQALVGEDGRVEDTKVVKSLPGLDAAAIACVKTWRFKPAMSKDQRPAAVWVAVPVRFALDH